MARSKAVIKAQVISYISGIPIISQLVTNPSQVQYNNNFIDIVARAINFLEQLMDVLKTDLEDKISKGAVGNSLWVQDKILNYFQYSATNPQVIELINGVPAYPTVDANLRIVTRCSINTDALNVCVVKVAKNNPPEVMLTAEVNALSSFLNQGGDGTLIGNGRGMGFAGVYYKVNSYDADKLYLDAEIIYNGQYASIIKSSVEAAINDYLSNIPFDSKVNVLDLEIKIKSVTGVADVIINDMAVRADTTLFADKTYLVQSKTTILSSYPTYAGYIVGETTVGKTFADKLTYTAQ